MVGYYEFSNGRNSRKHDSIERYLHIERSFACNKPTCINVTTISSLILLCSSMYWIWFRVDLRLYAYDYRECTIYLMTIPWTVLIIDFSIIYSVIFVSMRSNKSCTMKKTKIWYKSVHAMKYFTSLISF